MSADGLSELSINPILLQRLQVFAWLEAYGLSWRDVYFRACSRIPADASLPWFHGKHPEAAQLHPIFGLERVLLAIEDRIAPLVRFLLAHSRPLPHLIHVTVFPHFTLPFIPNPPTPP